MQKIKVSIIVPCYNKGKYLEETLRSIINQTYEYWECIIINDGSKDNTEEISLKYCKKDVRFKYIYQENSGVCVARNKAINRAKGLYILCLDADDIISNNFLEKTVFYLDNDDTIKVVSTKVITFGFKKEVINLPKFSLETLVGRNIFCNTSLFRKEDFIRVGGYNVNMSKGLEDWDFWISILEKGGTAVYENQAILFYRILPKSRNNSLKEKEYRKLKKQIWENHKELYGSYYLDPALDDCYLKIYLSREYRLGKILLAPFNYISGLFRLVFFKLFG
ncbi:glycosyltransferase [Apibacter adventoris]|uniref:glycosyltransferase n=1 Tax=Apibacter adventoris TaxID=1679466 RepID=UPI001C88A24A|nr:glycosyltransferase family A protein [Apibacter adventoris]